MQKRLLTLDQKLSTVNKKISSVSDILTGMKGKVEPAAVARFRAKKNQIIRPNLSKVMKIVYLRSQVKTKMLLILQKMQQMSQLMNLRTSSMIFNSTAMLLTALILLPAKKQQKIYSHLLKILQKLMILWRQLIVWKAQQWMIFRLISVKSLTGQVILDQIKSLLFYHSLTWENVYPPICSISLLNISTHCFFDSINQKQETYSFWKQQLISMHALQLPNILVIRSQCFLISSKVRSNEAYLTYDSFLLTFFLL